MDEKFKTWLVMSGIMMLVIGTMCLILKICEIIELNKFKKKYFNSIIDGDFHELFPNMSGVWEVDKIYYFIDKENERKMKLENHHKLLRMKLSEKSLKREIDT